MPRLPWLILGLACVGLGAVGVVVPGLPTTVFFIVAAASFARSSPRLERWVLNLPGIGGAVRDYRAGLGMPAAAKVAAVTSILVFGGWAVVLLRDRTWAQVLVAVAGLSGIAFVCAGVRTRRG